VAGEAAAAEYEQRQVSKLWKASLAARLKVEQVWNSKRNALEAVVKSALGREESLQEEEGAAKRTELRKQVSIFMNMVMCFSLLI
jgi:hypothetical protein